MAVSLWVCLFNAAFTAVFLFSILLAGIQYVFRRDRALWYYAAYLLSCCLFFLFDRPSLPLIEPIFPAWPLYVDQWSTLLNLANLVFYFLFANEFLFFRTVDPRTSRMLRLVVWALVGYLLLDRVLVWGFGISDVGRWGSERVKEILGVFGLYILYRVFRLRNPMVSLFAVGSLCFTVGSLTALVLARLDRPFATDEAPFLFVQIGCLLEITFFNLGLNYRARQLEQSNLQLALASQGERDRIARDLHDDVGSVLSSLAFYSDAAGQLYQRGRYGELYELLQKIAAQARRTIEQMSDVVWSIQDPMPSAESLRARLLKTAHDLTTSGHQTITVSTPLSALHTDAVLPANVLRNLYLIGKEALHNAVKYAGAHEIRLAVFYEGPSLVMEIKDDGCGFEPDQTGSGNGLFNMQQRAETAGASLDLKSVPGVGTVVRVQYTPDPAKDNHSVAGLDDPVTMAELRRQPVNKPDNAGHVI
ncbi:sensor histidine kinase [Tellurirhabdus rosea]|uniref:sensor histidine kinase n=1 Tax=Tellurirhabdus rosea TaxID=2674997 RepID=UPI002250D37A|nr:sensor histidine kinase [Tellurirhabdus rosea]